jgi:hypothetical protein
MYGGVVSNPLGHYKVQKGSQISGLVPFEEEAELEGVANQVVTVTGSRDMIVHRKDLINLLCGITLCGTFARAPPHGVLNTTDYRR